MREILFRGKQINNGKFVFGCYYKQSEFYGDKVDDHIIITSHEDLSYDQELDYYDVKPETVGQFTGLTDKNGKKIFEGDIIKIPDDYDEFGHNAGEIYEVYFFLGGFRLKPKYSKARGYWLEDDETVEVIGNIHDNPDLLKGGAEDDKPL